MGPCLWMPVSVSSVSASHPQTFLENSVYLSSSVLWTELLCCSKLHIEHGTPSPLKTQACWSRAIGKRLRYIKEVERRWWKLGLFEKTRFLFASVSLLWKENRRQYPCASQEEALIRCTASASTLKSAFPASRTTTNQPLCTPSRLWAFATD